MRFDDHHKHHIFNGDFRCKRCNKLLARQDNFSVSLEIKCVRCGTMNGLLEDANEMVIVADHNGVILYVNALTSDMTGYPADELIGQKPSIWGGQMTTSFYEELWTKIKTEKRAVAVRVENRHKSGQPYTAYMRISPVLDARGEVRLFIGIAAIKGDQPPVVRYASTAATP